MTIKPALSSEAWGAFDQEYEGKPALEHLADSGAVVFLEVLFGETLDKHGGAAALLHGQEYGFTWADVDELRDIADFHTQQGEYHSPEQIALWLSIADRIESLLPPRENTGTGKP